jgi:hypothetical protein
MGQTPMSDETNISPEECFDRLKPWLADLAYAIRTAPCDEAGLAVMVATYTFALAAQSMGKSAFTDGREVADLIVNATRAAVQRMN